MTFDDPKYNNKYQTNTFFFYVEQPKLAECHTSIVQPKEP